MQKSIEMSMRLRMLWLGYMHFMNTRANAARVPLLSNEAQLKFRA